MTTATTFRALRIELDDDGRTHHHIATRSIDDLPAGDLLIDVHYSTLNYKDALSAAGHKGVTRQYPHTPGIDAAGIVRESADERFKPGDEVIAGGYDLGMNTPGGLAEAIRVPADWALACPGGLTLREAMIYGTGGLTAGQCGLELEAAGVLTEGAEVAVTGATGGVGGFAVAMLARLGARPVAVSGKAGAEADWLRSIGAAEVISREDFMANAERPLLKARWAGGVDTVGGDPLSAMLKSTAYGGAVAACGNAASVELNTTVFPFILRGVRLIGIDSAECPMPRRRQVWAELTGRLRPDGLERFAREATLEETPDLLESMLAGAHRGKTLVRLR